MTHKILDHTADVQFTVKSETLKDLFIESAKVTQNVFCEDKIKKKIKKKIKISGRDLENLLYNFLEEILFLFDSEQFLISEIKMKIDEEKRLIEATLFGDNAKDYEIFSHIKAVTYNEMYVKKNRQKWTCLVTLDI